VMKKQFLYIKAVTLMGPHNFSSLANFNTNSRKHNPVQFLYRVSVVTRAYMFTKTTHTHTFTHLFKITYTQKRMYLCVWNQLVDTNTSERCW
jgi:hypothetical protein